MADKKNKVIVYKDWISTFDKLSDDEAGKLIKHFFQYINDLNPESDDRLITLLFEPIKQTLKRDLKAYEARCDKNKESVEKRWNESNTNVTDKVQPNTNEYKRIQPNTKHTDNDSDNDSDNDNEKNISVSESAHALIKFIKDKCPQVAKMKYPLTLEESERLVNEYSKTDIAKLFNEMDNWGDLKKKTSANKTFRSWAQRGSVQKIIEKAEYKFQPKAISSELPQQSIQFLHDKFGLPLDWNEYEIPSRSYFIKAHQNQEIKRYFL
jgi:hypothetical protein